MAPPLLLLLLLLIPVTKKLKLLNNVSYSKFEIENEIWRSCIYYGLNYVDTCILYNVYTIYRSLLSRMIVVEPKTRITVDEIVSHPWCSSAKKGGPINGLVHEVNTMI